MEGLREPTLLQTVRAHRSEVNCADAFGARLVTGAGDRSLRLWRWAAGAGWCEDARAAAAHRYGVTAVRWAASGVLVASGGVDGVVRVWCGRTLGARRALAAPAAHAVRALCWAGRRLLAGHDDGALCVWLVGRGVLAARLHSHEGALHAVATPARATLVLTACTHGVLKVFDFAVYWIEVCRSGTEGASATPLMWVDGAHDMGALCADASEDGRAAATGGHDALVRLWRASEVGLAEGDALEGHAAAVTALRWAGSGGALLASASLDRTARLWSPAAATCLHVVHAHPRYLTCIVLAHDLRYMVTGSNDKSVRMWSLGSLTLDDDLEPPCATLAHFGLGDLEGIGPVECDELSEEAKETAADGGDEVAEAGGARRLWHAPAAHAGAVNCIATCGDRLATASSDGTVKVFRWCADARALLAEHTLDAHQYPAMAVDFGAGGALLLTAGLDGRAALWDAQTGVQLQSLSVPSAGAGGSGGGGGGGGEAGGGGVRAARVSPHRPPLLLLATDDGLAPLWSLAATEPTPLHVFGGHAEAATCCAWSRDGRVAATGAASGELRVHAPRPAPATLHHQPHAHDLGVQSCDFAPSSSALDLPDTSHVLASAGCDSLIKLWIVEYAEEDDSRSTVTVRLVREFEAHGGGVTCVRWGPAGVGAGAGLPLASAGADRWARVWRVLRGGAELWPVASVPAPDAGGALAVALSGGDAQLLAAGTMTGGLALWRLPGAEPPEDASEDDEGAPPCLWTAPAVARWLREYVTRAPGAQVSPEEEARLLHRALHARITGARLLRDPLDELLQSLGYGREEHGDGAEEQREGGRAATRARLSGEVRWLRRGPPPPRVEASAAHALLCPLTHRLLREPARAADGFSYERAAILDWFIAAEGAVSPVSGRRLRNSRAPPNYALRNQLRAFLDQHENNAII